MNEKTEFIRQASERMHYYHRMLWRGIEFFVLTVSGLITVSVTISSLSLYAALVVLVLTVSLTFLGRYVLVKESGYFHEERYKLLILRKEMGYYEVKGLQESPDLRETELSLKEYLDESVKRKKGVRYAFRLLYAGQAWLCWAVYLALVVSRYSLLRSEEVVFNTSLISVLAVMIIVGYKWEIESLFCRGEQEGERKPAADGNVREVAQGEKRALSGS
jgi:hypothetical protein